MEELRSSKNTDQVATVLVQKNTRLFDLKNGPERLDGTGGSGTTSGTPTSEENVGPDALAFPLEHPLVKLLLIRLVKLAACRSTHTEGGGVQLNRNLRAEPKAFLA